MIQIYGKQDCPFCLKAKQLCESQALMYEYYEFEVDYSRELFLETFPGANTVPQIVVNGTKIGGYNELTKYIEETGYNGTGSTL